ncbi:hypothetical protein XO10_01380 [Marinitoga sp. 1135]|uniref:MFS transporter n=1 Tax=unclassified Marinitoga TaxID=2640159 RepID=UPI0009504492|nr:MULTISPECIES: MFS transporter [unclassified Marinitoga]APT75181.1 hypothetical protein LN42_01295 [Marinitoga sp. 1137]NUU94955.1 hypothetical protein [Marinitoga sp. 1135]NUU96924.1 hypothetical protein [Marinitoga sp. 1138]
MLGQITNNIVYYSFLPFLSFYLSGTFNVSQIGFMISYRSISNISGILIGGGLADRVRPEKVMVICLTGASCIYFCLAFINNYIMYSILLSTIGFLSGISYPCESVLIMRNTNSKNRAEVFAIIRVILNISASIAPILAVKIFIKYHIITFSILALLNIIYVISIIAFFKGNDINQIKNGKILDTFLDEIWGIIKIFKDYKFLLLIMAFTLSTVATYSIETTLPLYLNIYYHNAEYLYSFIILLNTWLVILLQIPLSKFSKFITYTKSAILGQLLVGISFIFLALIHNSVGLIIIFIVFTIGEILISPGATLLIVDNCSSNNTGKYLSIGKLRLFLALPISSSIGGYLLNLKMDKTFLYMYGLFAFSGATLLFFLINKINDSSVKFNISNMNNII